MSAGQAIGAVIGFIIGGPKGAYWGYMAGSVIDPPPGPHQEGPRLNDRVIQTSEDGAPLPTDFGTVRHAGNVIWSSGLEEIATTTEQGGGSGGGGATATTYSYKTDVAIALCAGEITGVRRIWADAKLIYDASETSDLNTLLGSEQKFAGLRIYVGSETQDPDPLIQAVEGAANTPAFRGIAYVVFEDMQLADYGNRLPNFSFEVVKAGSISTLTFHSASEEISQTIYNVGYGEDDNLYCFYSAGNIASHSGPNYGNATYYKIDIDGVKTQLFSGDLDIVETGYSSILTRPATYNEPAILYAPANLHLIVREFYGQKDAVHQGGFFVYNGNETGRSFATTPDYAVSAAGIGVGAWKGTIAFKSATEGVCSCNKNGPLVWFNSGITTTIIAAGVYSRGVGAIAFFDSSFLVVVNATGYATFYWYDYDFNLIDSALSTVIAGQKFFSFNDEDNCLYGVQSGSSLIKIGPVDSSSTFNYSEVLTVSGTISPSRTVDSSENSTPAINTRHHNVLFFSQNLTAAKGFRGIVATRNLLAQSGTDLETVAETIIESAGIDAAEYDMSALSADTVRGYTVGRPMSARAALEPLRTAYHFDTSERDGKIYAIKRGGAVVATITDDDLGAAESPDGVKLRLTRHNESELPSEIQISYSDIDNDHQAGTQYARSLIARVTNIQQISLPLAMTSEEATQLAEIILNAARYTGRHTLEFNLSYAWSRLVPSDVVSVPGYGVQWTARIGQVDIGMPGLVQCQASPEIAALYASILAGGDPTGIGQTIGLTGTTTLTLLDCCMLRDTDTDLAWYAALTGSVDTWPGGAAYKSNDSGATWTLATAATRTMSAKIGSATAILPNADCRVWDKTNRLNVRMQAGATLSSATELAVLNGANAGLLGAHGRWELIQWQIATLESDGTYTLSDLLRGRKGTEHAAGSHASGDVFVVPEATTISQIDVSSSELNAERLFKALTNGQALEAVDAVTATYTGERLKPLAPALFNAATQANGDIRMTWTRRDRIARAWASAGNLAQSESAESYEVDVVVSGVVVQTLTSSTNSLTYENFDQTEYVTGSAVTLNLYQISATVGRGHVASASCTSAQTAIYVPRVVVDEADFISDDTTPIYMIDTGSGLIGINANHQVHSADIPTLDTLESTLPVNWQPTYGQEDARRVAYGGGKTIVAWGNQTAVSSNLNTWTTANFTGGLVRCVVYDGTRFVLATTGGVIYSSTDGITWTQRADLARSLYQIAANGTTQYVVIGASNYVATSPDLITWTDRSPTVNTYRGAAVPVGLGESATWVIDSAVWNSAGSQWIIGGRLTRSFASGRWYWFYPIVLTYDGATTYAEKSPYVGVLFANTGKTVESVAVVGSRVQLIGFNMLMSCPAATVAAADWTPGNVQPDQGTNPARMSLAYSTATSIGVYNNSTRRLYTGDGSTTWD